jgi:KRAB domain-containing zinc finger protein
MPKSIKREVTRKEIKGHGSRELLKFSKFQCKICQRYLYDEKSLKNHTELHFQPSRYDCKKCERTFELKWRFDAHKCVKKSERHFCNFCEKNFSQALTLKKHMKKIHADKIKVDLFTCDFCDEKFITKYRLKSHLNDFRCRKIFTCYHCGKKFNEKDNIARHVRIHAKFKIKCEICHTEINLSRLNRHKADAHANQSIECKLCTKVFKNSYAFKNHQKFHGTKKFCCKLCDRKFSIRSHFNYHLRFHKNPEILQCQICGHQSTTKQNLTLHSRTHNKNREKNLKCDKCDYKTDRKDHFNNHLKLHEKLAKKLKNNPNAIKCEKCPSVLLSLNIYQKHLKTKHKIREKPQCDLCGRNFYDKKNLSRHLDLKKCLKNCY